MADNFLEPDDERALSIASPYEPMPGLAGHNPSRVDDPKHGRF